MALLAAVVGVLVALVVSLAGPVRTVSAHAELESTSPAGGSVLDRGPSQIVLTFSEPVDLVPDAIRLVAADGSAIDIGDAEHGQGAASMTATVPALADGTYVVAWRAVSSDSHPVAGAFTFSVGAPTDTAPGLVDELIGSNAPDAAAERWLGVGRAVSFGAVGVLLGTFFVLAVCAPGTLRNRRAGLVLGASSLLGVVATAVMIAAQAKVTVGQAFSTTAWREVFDSRAGGWWVIRLIMIAAGAVAVPVRRRFSPRGLWPTVVLLYAAALLAVVAAGGHSVSGRWVAVGFLATVVHLAAMAAWLGGLAGLGLVVPRDRLRAAALRFSPIALTSVIALALSGTLNAWRQAGSFGSLTDSSYGRWLIVKLVVIAGVVAVAGASRWLLRSASSAPGEDEEGADRGVAPALRRTVLAEVVGIALVLATTAGLVNSPPPRDTAASGPASVSVVEGNRIAQITLDPAVTGGTTMHVILTSTGGSLDQPIDMTVTASLPDKQIQRIALPLVVSGPGHLTGDDIDLPIAGTWTFTINARYGEFDQVTFTAELTVR